MTPQEMLDKAVLGLFISPTSTNSRPSSFLASIYCSLRVIWDDGCPTAYVNRRLHLGINKKWFASLSDAMRETLLAHEIWHVALLHLDPLRLGDRCWRRWNQACDYAINWMLHLHGFKFDRYPADHLHAGEVIGLLDARFEDMTPEEIYDILKSEGQEIYLPFGEDFDPGDSDDPLTPEETVEITSVIIRAVTMSKLNGDPGKFPGSITMMVDKLMNPRLPWDSLVRKWLTERSEYGASWRRPSRRFQDVFMPGRSGQEGLAYIRWYLDCSCSVTDAQFNLYVSVMAEAKDTHNPERMTVTTFDTELGKTVEFDQNQIIKDLDLVGRGGTCLVPVMADIKLEKPNAVIIISDLCVDIPPNPDVDILWICVDNPRATVPYGQIIHLDSASITR